MVSWPVRLTFRPLERYIVASISNVHQTVHARDSDAATSPKMFMPRLALKPYRFLLVVSLWSVNVAFSRAASVSLNPMHDTFISEAFATPNGAATDMVIGTQGSTAGFTKN